MIFTVIKKFLVIWFSFIGKEGKSICLDPLNPDSDGDGINDGDEIADKTNPLNAKDNINIRRRNLILAVFGGIIGTIALYYLLPSTFSRLRKNVETKWVSEGLTKRREKHEKMQINLTQHETKNDW